MKPSPIPPVMYSETSWKVDINIIIANAPIAQCAPLSRYKYWASVFFSTSIIVNERTKNAPIESPIVIIKISELKANAPNTPSSENDASINSKYKKLTRPVHFAQFATSFALSSSCFSSA